MTAALHDLMNHTEGLPCREDSEPFFSDNPAFRRYAARQCRRCPLLLACMRYALDAGEKHGVWGGVDFESRTVGCGTDRGYWSHKSRREDVCAACLAAHEEVVDADRRRRLAAEHGLGGSVRGYWLHRRLGEGACVPCKRAVARQSQERRARDRADAERARAEWDAPKVADPLRGPETGVQRLALAG